MAGDWIKMRADLLTHPKVVRMMSALKADKFRIVGGLMSVWCLFDAHSEDGRLSGYTPELLDTMVAWDGFAAAMVSIGWLHVGANESLELPRFDAHNGQSAKRRAQDADRKREGRKTSASDADKKRTREEKRREEKKEQEEQKQEPLPPPAATKMATSLPKDWKPGPEQIAQAKESRPDVDVALEAQKFVDYWIAKGGKEGRKLDWDATWRNWIRNARGVARGAVHDPDWRKVAV